MPTIPLLDVLSGYNTEQKALALTNLGLGDLGQKNEPDGYVGINSDGIVLGTFAQRIGTAAEISAITLANGELAFTTDTKETFIGDGVTSGGSFLWQQPKWGTKNYTGLIAPPAAGAATSTTSIVLGTPVILVGYRIRVAANFTGGSGNDSNFAIAIDSGVSVPFGSSIVIKECWATETGTVLERRDKVLIAESASRQFELLTTLTRSSGSLILDIDIMPRIDLTIYGGAESVLGPIAVTACRRAGSGDSVASANVYATCQRMWTDGRVF